MKKDRNITNLLDLDKPVYLVFRNQSLWKIFIDKALSEGFFINPDMPYNSYIKQGIVFIFKQ